MTAQNGQEVVEEATVVVADTPEQDLFANVGTVTVAEPEEARLPEPR